MKYCDFNGCPNRLAKGRYCEEHRGTKKPIKKSLYDTSNKQLYNSKEWKAIRQFVYEREKGCCQRCGKFVFGKQAQVHHKVPVKADASLKLEPDNLKLLCPKCHSIEENYGEKEIIFKNYFFKNPPGQK
jgi:5-methylcytosine-specific restriction enzyme A